MKLKEYLNLFKKYINKKIFTINEISTLTNIDKKTLSVELNRLVKDGVIERVSKGIYINPLNKPTIEELASFLKYPSYISMEYALFVENILPQAVYVVTLITTSYPYVYHYKDYTFEYHHINKEFFFGFYKESSGTYLAYPEKALLDLIYIRYKKGRMSLERLESFIDDLYLEEIDKNRLLKWGEIMGMLPFLMTLKKIMG